MTNRFRFFRSVILGGGLMLTFFADPARAEDGASEIELPENSVHREAISRWLEGQLPDLVKQYQHFHAHPELSFQEFKTATAIARTFESAGFAVTRGVGRTGVVGVLENGKGPTLLIRGDMDALPIIEETGLDYASQIRLKDAEGKTIGAMHACGHDVHITLLLGMAPLLAELREHWSGTVVLVAQPAEEIGKGSLAMIEDGLFERFPRPDYCLSLHVDSNLPAGTVGYTSGYAFANVDSVDITIFGRGGHGARPEETIDPIVTAAHVVVALQTIVSRRTNPSEPAVVTVGSIQGGTKHNIIPGEVKLQLTVRSYSDEVRRLLLDSIRQITTDTCRTFQVPKDPEIRIDERQYTPASYNDPALTRAAMDLMATVVGAENIRERPSIMAGEDFGRYAKVLGVPGLQYRIGVVSPERMEAAREPGGDPLPSIHSSRFYPEPEPTVRIAVESMANLALGLLGSE